MKALNDRETRWHIQIFKKKNLSVDTINKVEKYIIVKAILIIPHKQLTKYRQSIHHMSNRTTSAHAQFSSRE